MHIALLGDSTFDNGAYTDGGPAVVDHLNRLLEGTGRATLLARDGATLATVHAQLEALSGLISEPDGPTHVALSAGGNDLLGMIDVLAEPVGSVGEGLLRLRQAARRFGASYRALLDAVVEAGLPPVICTVYNGAFEDPAYHAMVETALRVFDQEIVNAGVERQVPVVDLRSVCASPDDYWNPIEPGERGGARIAAAIAQAFRIRTPAADPSPATPVT